MRPMAADPRMGVVNATRVLGAQEGTSGCRPAARGSSHPGFTDGKPVDLGTEFGGTYGVAGIMLFSHALVFLLHLWLNAPGVPLRDAAAGLVPTWTGLSLYAGLLVVLAVLDVTMPGLWVYGLPLPSMDGKRLRYCCNGVAVWYSTLALLAALHVSGALPLTVWVDNLGSLTTCACLVGDAVAVWLWIWADVTGTAERASGEFLYDVFMGVVLNPRVRVIPGLRAVDVKMFCELRVPWILLFVLTSSCAAKHYELFGYVSAPLAFMVLAHGLYANACAKGDQCVPTTFDIFHEKFGWMLAFWNLAGVPLAYQSSSVYLLRAAQSEGTPVTHGAAYTAGVFVLLLLAYVVWDTANSQKNVFRMKRAGTYVARTSFPQLPWGELGDDAACIQTSSGSQLLVDGWYRYARKPHYTADIAMALSWGLICGFESVLPYWYVVFFTVMIVHRCQRDFKRCSKKYGVDWATYVSRVPYIFFPGLI